MYPILDKYRIIVLETNVPETPVLRGTMTGRRRGAQPGNTNALVHGFYSRQMKAGEIADLSTILPDLNGEIAMLRVLAGRAVQAVSQAEHVTLDDWSMLLNSIGSAFIRISSLTRTQALLSGEDKTMNSCLSQALSTVLKDWKVTQK
jgi:hypothetical protein